MADKCFAIYFANEINQNNPQEKFIIDVSIIGFFSRPLIKKAIYATPKEIIDITSMNSEIDVEFDNKYYLVGSRTEDSISLIFTTEPKPHYHLLTLSKYIIFNYDLNNIPNNMKEIFSLIESEIKIKNLQDNMQETKFILFETLESLKKRDEDIHNLVDKSKKLAEISGGYKKKTDELNNKCCILI